jgi:hypothetical protein
MGIELSSAIAFPLHAGDLPLSLQIERLILSESGCGSRFVKTCLYLPESTFKLVNGAVGFNELSEQSHNPGLTMRIGPATGSGAS